MNIKYHGTYLCCSQCGQHYPYSHGLIPAEQARKESELLKENAIQGYLGPEWEKIVSEYPDGDFDCSQWKLLRCSCGAWANTSSTSYRWNDLADGKEHVKEFKHSCPQCGKEMYLLTENDPPVKCMKCGGELVLRHFE